MQKIVAILFLSLLSIMAENLMAATCTTSANCDDGRYCNGREICAIPAGQTNGTCLPARNTPCPAELGMACNETSNSCTKVMCRNDAQCIDQDPCDAKRACSTEDGLDTFNNLTQVWGCKKVSTPSCPADRVCQPNRSAPYGFNCVHPNCVDPDKDGDGYKAINCGGNDCNDNDATTFPGNAEVCDSAHHDEDCNVNTFGNKDDDKDGHVDIRCCNKEVTGKEFCGEDCDDGNRSMFPGMQACTREMTEVFICGRGILSCGSGNICAPQPNGLGVCIPQ
jgi:hypothetical protein